MCGRYARYSDKDRLLKQYGIDKILAELRASFNIAPTQEVAVLRMTDDLVECGSMRWGMFSAWSPQPIINARSETIESKAMFKEAFARRRCVLPADGFYEWQRVGSKKQPYFVTLKGDLMMFAGLWSPGEVESCAVITTAAPKAFSHVHDRVPLILDATEVREWLNPATPLEKLREIISKPTPEMVLTPVSTAVGNVRNDGPELIQPSIPAKPQSDMPLFDFN